MNPNPCDLSFSTSSTVSFPFFQFYRPGLRSLGSVVFTVSALALGAACTDAEPPSEVSNGAAGSGGILLDPDPPVTRSAGCDQPPLEPPLDQTFTFEMADGPLTVTFPGPWIIEVKGESYGYLIQLPDNYDPQKSYPVAFGFHGAQESPLYFAGYMPKEVNPNYGTHGSRWLESLPDAIRVFPAAHGEGAKADNFIANPNRHWTGELQRHLELFDALLAHVQANYCVDPTRVFVGGHSSGGGFVNWLACVRGDVIRASAPNAGYLPESDPTPTCTGQAAHLIVHGALDQGVPFVEAERARDRWLAENGCDASWEAPEGFPNCQAHANCDAGYPVWVCPWTDQFPPHAYWEPYGPVTAQFFGSLETPETQ